MFQVELPEAEATEREFSPVGIDLGLSPLATLSTGEKVPCPAWTEAAAKMTRRLSRALARMERCDSGWKRAKRELARHHRRVANRRRGFLHKLSAGLIPANRCCDPCPAARSKELRSRPENDGLVHPLVGMTRRFSHLALEDVSAARLGRTVLAKAFHNAA